MAINTYLGIDIGGSTLKLVEIEKNLKPQRRLRNEKGNKTKPRKTKFRGGPGTFKET